MTVLRRLPRVDVVDVRVQPDALTSAAIASVCARPTTSGTVDFGLPVETMSVTVEPFARPGSPPSGSWPIDRARRDRVARL